MFVGGMSCECMYVHGANELSIPVFLQTRVVDRFMKNILKYVEDGMEDSMAV